MTVYYQVNARGFWLMLQSIDVARRVGVHSVDLYPILVDGQLRYWWHRDLGRIEPA